uniref:Uncharacterized protein n=1 Tax=Trypanosoma congolense (strain IL3000) TaxID=1068625 RepID=G0UW00_TRYCI|nr:conserved hypothetical protein [Trypanosoma congolense IL3000]
MEMCPPLFLSTYLSPFFLIFLFPPLYLCTLKGLVLRRLRLTLTRSLKQLPPHPPYPFMALTASAPAYVCASLRGVLERTPGVPQRPHIPRGSRTHVSLAAATLSETKGAQELGGARLLRVYGALGPCVKDAENGNDSANEQRGAFTERGKPLPLTLTGLIATDSNRGTCITRRTIHSSGDVRWVSPTIPSGQRIGCVQLSLETRSALMQEDRGTALFPSPQLYVADVVGNTYVASLPTCSVCDNAKMEPPMKRPRLEEEPDVETNELLPFWQCVTTPADGTRSFGAPGWCGLTPLRENQLACCREFFFDLRLLDTSVSGEGAVVRQYGTIHAATGMTTCAGVFPHSVIVAEGPVASVYDTRCSAAVMAQEACGPRGHAYHPLVTSRYTDPMAQIADVCGTDNEFEVVLAAGRALYVTDIRKWTRVGVTTNVLKYNIGSIASFASGRGLVAVGVDAELRIVSLRGNCGDPPTGGVTDGHGSVEHGDVDAKKGGSGDHTAGKVKEVEATTSFRNRIDSVVRCQSTWQGGWVTGLDGSFATGISADHEFFMAL